MFHRWVAQLSDDELTRQFLYATPYEAITKKGSITFIKRLGSGAFGEVFGATYNGEEVAVKEMAIRKIDVEMLTNKNMTIRKESRISMFNSEVAFLKRLHHPNILKLVDGFQFDKEKYIVITEICAGGELFDAIAGNGHLKISDARRVLRDVLSAVQYMHDMNVVHRDLKPENILLSVPWISDTAIPPVKIIDFGLAANWKGTPLYDICGTPNYAAPEVLLLLANKSTNPNINRGYGKECDLFSVGVILFVMLGGYLPFDGVNHDKVFWKIINGLPDFNDGVWNDVPETTKSFINRLLVKDPSERPSARAAIDDPFFETDDAGDIKVSVENLRGFVKMSKLKRLIRHEIAASLTIADQKRYLNAFGNGETMSKKDAQAKLLSYGIKKGKIVEFFNALDQNNNEKWDVAEFIAAVMEKHLYDTFETVRRAFGKLDKDGNGYITLAELENAVGETSANAIMEEIHGNGGTDGFDLKNLETYFKTHQPTDEEDGAEDTGSKAEEKSSENPDAGDFGVGYGEGEACSVQ